VARKTCLILLLSTDKELRYFDDSQMGKVYYVDASQTKEIPNLIEQGPDVLDEKISLSELQTRFKPFRGEMKGILTRGAFISGIGNPYSDEILFTAQLFPFRKRTYLKADEVDQLYQTTLSVPKESVAILRDKMGADIHLKIRDFLQVHDKGGKPCPRCSNSIAAITANRRVTTYCRHCQPGMLLKN